MTTIRLYRYQQPGAKRWKKTNHRMDEATAREWFSQFHPGAAFEPLDYGAIEIDDSKDWHIGPTSHGGPKR